MLVNLHSFHVLQMRSQRLPTIIHNLKPNLGVVDTENGGFIIADIPGLIEGASEGVGLGH